ncbi:flagellar basal body P-ring protein FlgI [Yersinia pseudotuberculosis]|uniref:flagellar basal body P-ring protein FlgI n=1 Tax=Yersinia pseudotuberculosis TaxID=633 RepID=UPI002E7859E1|nr:flagellar basal body P-ring protein FlgI [Yersinia pseudotuberculosis]
MKTRHCFVLLGLWLVLPTASAQPLGSLVDIQGVRGNQLVGYSLVVGLDGSGDKNQVKFTGQSMANMLRQFGVQLPEKMDPKVKNVAAVAISATLPPGYGRGQSIDITVSSIGDAKSLRGGTLLLTQLRGADGEVYALAQGNVVVGGIKAEGDSGSSVTVNTPTVGRIPNGASIERQIPSDFQTNNQVVLNLKRPSFKSANNVALALNRAFGANTATAQSATNVMVNAPQDAGARVAFMSLLEDVQINAGEQSPRVVFNARNRVQHATIRLDPPDMGKIDISIHFEGGKLQVNINANQGEVYRALQQSSAELRQTLIGQNSTEVNVQVSANSQQQQQQPRHSNHHGQADILAAQHFESQAEINADDGTLLITI